MFVCDITTAQETLRISYANTQKTSSVRMLLTLYLIGLDIDSQILAFFGLVSRLFLSAPVKVAETFYYVNDLLFPMVYSLLASDA